MAITKLTIAMPKCVGNRCSYEQCLGMSYSVMGQGVQPLSG